MPKLQLPAGPGKRGEKGTRGRRKPDDRKAWNARSLNQEHRPRKPLPGVPADPKGRWYFDEDGYFITRLRGSEVRVERNGPRRIVTEIKKAGFYGKLLRARKRAAAEGRR